METWLATGSLERLNQDLQYSKSQTLVTLRVMQVHVVTGEVRLRSISVCVKFDRDTVSFSHVNESFHMFYLAPNIKRIYVIYSTQFQNLLRPWKIIYTALLEAEAEFCLRCYIYQIFFFRIRCLTRQILCLQLQLYLHTTISGMVVLHSTFLVP